MQFFQLTDVGLPEEGKLGLALTPPRRPGRHPVVEWAGRRPSAFTGGKPRSICQWRVGSAKGEQMMGSSTSLEAMGRSLMVRIPDSTQAIIPNPPQGIVVELTIATDQRNPFHHGLSNDQTIKGIAVKIG